MVKVTIASLQLQANALQEEIGVLRSLADEEKSKRFAATRERDEAVKVADALRSELFGTREDVARLGGMLDMLREMGVIPTQPVENIGTTYSR